MPDARDSGTTREDGSILDIYERCRDEAVRRVDGRHGFTVEFSPDPEAHRAEYDEEEATVIAEQLRGAVSMVEALTDAARGTSSAGGVYCKLCNGPAMATWEDLTHSCPLGGQ